ncbi:uncharacterized protein [Nicotiana tomentosiformis]|uniref:uncharacterized protein n=1 Tax=Nicotiana tomentosiformis TaxID=4098 RepID=UPI00388C7097
MIKAIFWNIRGVRYKKAIYRLKNLISINNTQFVAIFEPFVIKDKIEGYRKFLGYQSCIANDNGKIWCLWNHNYQSDVLVIENQQITIKLNNNSNNYGIFVTSVYAKCTILERSDLWYSLKGMCHSIDGPWCIEGDFNVITDSEEKLGGKTHRIYKSLKFINCMDNCGVTDLGFSGSKFTWCNNRRPRKRVWKRLDMGRTEANKVHAEYVSWLSLQESLLKQKSQSKWFEEGDANTNYFHSILREKRRRLQLHKIKNRKEKWIQGEEKIAREAVKYFEVIFNLPKPAFNNSILDCIPHCIQEEENDKLTGMPTEEEIKVAIFSLSADSRVWYSIIINGSRADFFTSSQGLKQGDPLSPSLFIIAAEVLTRSLNMFNSN